METFRKIDAPHSIDFVNNLKLQLTAIQNLNPIRMEILAHLWYGQPFTEDNWLYPERLSKLVNRDTSNLSQMLIGSDKKTMGLTEYKLVERGEVSGRKVHYKPVFQPWVFSIIYGNHNIPKVDSTLDMFNNLRRDRKWFSSLLFGIDTTSNILEDPIIRYIIFNPKYFMKIVKKTEDPRSFIGTIRMFLQSFSHLKFEIEQIGRESKKEPIILKGKKSYLSYDVYKKIDKDDYENQSIECFLNLFSFTETYVEVFPYTFSSEKFFNWLRKDLERKIKKKVIQKEDLIRIINKREALKNAFSYLDNMTDEFISYVKL